MKNILSASLCFVMLVTGSCNYMRNVKLLTNGEVGRKDFTDTVSFDYRKGIVVMEGTVNGHSGEFIFDTGAFNSKVAKSTANELNLPTIATKTNSDSNGNMREIEVTAVESWVLGSTSFLDIGAGMVEYDASSYSPCIAKDGIIGGNLIKLLNWQLDFSAQKVVFSDGRLETSKKSNKLKFDMPLLSGTPYIEIDLDEEVKTSVLVDVGYNGGLILPASFLKNLQDLPSLSTTLDQSRSGIYGMKTDTVTTVAVNVTFGDVQFRLPVEFSTTGKALLGTDFLEHFLLTIDNDEKEIYFDQKSPVVIEKSAEYLPGMLNDTLWVVNRAPLKGSVQVGDTLQTVNGKKPKELFEDKCDYFYNVGKRLNDLEFVEKGNVKINFL